MLGFGSAILLRPARDLALEIIARFAEILEPDRRIIGAVQLGERLDLIGVDGVALFGRRRRTARADASIR